MVPVLLGLVEAFVGRSLVQALVREVMLDFATTSRAEIQQQADRMVLNLVRSIRVKVDDRAVRRSLDAIQSRKIPLVTAMALTWTAKDLQRVVEKEIDRAFDRPTAFTKRAIAIRPATVASQASAVFIKDRQAEYLLPQIHGGRRKPKRFEERFAADTRSPGRYWVAGAGTRLNSAGNISLAQVTKIAARLRKSGRDVFFGRPRNHPSLPFGIWERTQSKRGRAAAGIKPILVQVSAPHYHERLDFYGIAKREAQGLFKQNFGKAWRQVIG